MRTTLRKSWSHQNFGDVGSSCSSWTTYHYRFFFLCSEFKPIYLLAVIIYLLQPWFISWLSQFTLFISSYDLFIGSHDLFISSHDLFIAAMIYLLPAIICFYLLTVMIYLLAVMVYLLAVMIYLLQPWFILSSHNSFIASHHLFLFIDSHDLFISSHYLFLLVSHVAYLATWINSKHAIHKYTLCIFTLSLTPHIIINKWPHYAIAGIVLLKECYRTVKWLCRKLKDI